MSAQAASLPIVPQAAVLDGNASDLLTEVNHRRGHRVLRRNWDRHRDGPRFSRRYGNNRHFYRGYYYSSPWWTLPLIGGSIILGTQNRAYAGYGSAHIDWCEDRYRSYNVRTNTWVSYSGEIRQCRSPYN